MMNEWQVQEMFERETADLWERLNAPDPDSEMLQNAAQRIKCGLDSIDNGLDWLADAIRVLDGTPMADKVQSFLDSLEKLANDLEELNDKFERGRKD